MRNNAQKNQKKGERSKVTSYVNAPLVEDTRIKFRNHFGKEKRLEWHRFGSGLVAQGGGNQKENLHLMYCKTMYRMPVMVGF